MESKWERLMDFVGIRTKEKLYCIQDIEENFHKNGFIRDNVREMLNKHGYKRDDQVNRKVVEMLIENIHEIESDNYLQNKPNYRSFIKKYLTSLELRKLVLKYDQLDKYSFLLEKRFDLILLTNLDYDIQ